MVRSWRWRAERSSQGRCDGGGKVCAGSRPPSSSPREIDQSSLLIPPCRVGYRRPKPVGIAPAPSSPLLLYTHPKGLMVRGGVRWLLLSAQTRAPHAIGHPAPVRLRGELLDGCMYVCMRLTPATPARPVRGARAYIIYTGSVLSP